MNTSILFDEVIGITRENLDVLKKRFSHFSEQQRNWKPNPQVWSINEIFAHLNVFSRFYHTAFMSRIENTKFREPKENFISSPLGRSAWKSMKLGNAKNVKRKFNAQRAYNPLVDPSLVSGNDVVDFQSSQEELLQIIEKAKTINVRKAKVHISFSKIIRLRFGDALLYVVYHNERHVFQALNLIQHPAFPKKK